MVVGEGFRFEGLYLVLVCREDAVLLLNSVLGDRLVVGSTD